MVLRSKATARIFVGRRLDPLLSPGPLSFPFQNAIA